MYVCIYIYTLLNGAHIRMIRHISTSKIAGLREPLGAATLFQPAETKALTSMDMCAHQATVKVSATVQQGKVSRVSNALSRSAEWQEVASQPLKAQYTEKVRNQRVALCFFLIEYWAVAHFFQNAMVAC